MPHQDAPPPLATDSDDLKDTKELLSCVRDSACLVLVQSKHVLERPSCNMVAGAFVGSAYETVGWLGTSLLTGFVALVAFGVVVFNAPDTPAREPGQQARPASSGVGNALRSPGGA